MRKIIIAICGIFMFYGAYAAVNVVDTQIQGAWNFSGSNPKTSINDNYSSVEKNSEYDFEYVNIIAATNIYTHGAEFCRIQLQHNYGNWKVYVAPESCQTVCKEGYYGTRCNSETFSNCENNNLKEIFNSGANPSPYKEESIDVFYSSEYETILLSVVSVTEHSVTVAPVDFYGNNNKRTNIASIKTRGQSQVLCSAGYKLDGDTCVLTSQCDTVPENSSNESECPTTRKQGMNATGECEQCDDGKMFDKKKKKCAKEKSIDTHQLVHGIQRLFDCWREVGPAAYKECVTCPGGWEKDQKHCYI